MSSQPAPLDELLDELEDAVWCSRGDVQSQNKEAKKRVVLAKAALRSFVSAKEHEAENMVLDWRIEQWRRAKKYMLNDAWQPIFDELVALKEAHLNAKEKEV